MSWTVILHPPAQDEFDDAIDWFEANQPNRRDPFEAAVEAVLSSLAKNPLKRRKVMGEVRHVVVQKFKYVLYYFVTGRTVQVVSVFHSSRDPGIWQARIP